MIGFIFNGVPSLCSRLLLQAHASWAGSLSLSLFPFLEYSFSCFRSSDVRLPLSPASAGTTAPLLSNLPRISGQLPVGAFPPTAAWNDPPVSFKRKDKTGPRLLSEVWKYLPLLAFSCSVVWANGTQWKRLEFSAVGPRHAQGYNGGRRQCHLLKVMVTLGQLARNEKQKAKRQLRA